MKLHLRHRLIIGILFIALAVLSVGILQKGLRYAKVMAAGVLQGLAQDFREADGEARRLLTDLDGGAGTPSFLERMKRGSSFALVTYLPIKRRMGDLLELRLTKVNVNKGLNATLADVVYAARFANGEANVQVTMARRNGEWTDHKVFLITPVALPERGMSSLPLAPSRPIPQESRGPAWEM